MHWVAAIVATLPDQAKAALFDHLEKRVVAHKLPGSNILQTRAPGIEL